MKTIKNCTETYEVLNPSWPGVGLLDQIISGINNWRAENLITGAIGYGKTEAEAIINSQGCQ